MKMGELQAATEASRWQRRCTGNARRRPELELEFMAAHIQRTRRSAMGIITRDRTEWGKRGKGAQAHRKFACVVGEDEGHHRHEISAVTREEDEDDSEV
jgi:hypothetical protein